MSNVIHYICSQCLFDCPGKPRRGKSLKVEARIDPKIKLYIKVVKKIFSEQYFSQWCGDMDNDEQRTLVSIKFVLMTSCSDVVYSTVISVRINTWQEKMAIKSILRVQK